jgi:L-ribulose-5-phosphate 4-epimerase
MAGDDDLRVMAGQADARLEQLRDEVCQLNRQMQSLGLVRWSSMGSLSAREGDRIVFKPGRVTYDDLVPERMLIADLDGQVAGGGRLPTDAHTHLYLYRARPDIGSVIHMHSPYATAWCAVEEPMPLCLTAMEDLLGGRLPMGDYYAEKDSAGAGAEILRKMGDSPAILMRNHGVYCVGSSPKEVLRTAVMVEHVAQTAAIAASIGTPVDVPHPT